VEYIIVDGGSTDRSLDIIDRYRMDISRVIHEKDEGPADAINKGLHAAAGDLLAWLNSDDLYFPGALKRVVGEMSRHPGKALCFGHCPIVDEAGREIRRGITLFKELFYPVSSRFAVQSINYVSQPATFFRRRAFEAAGPLRTDLVAAWDYDLLLRLWRQGGAVRVPSPPLAAFRWHESSISGSSFALQFKEDWEVAAGDAGRLSPQSILHLAARWGIVGSYSLMRLSRRRNSARQGNKCS
jgi:glycosyltransferase involved in cell wall biosynthesis